MRRFRRKILYHGRKGYPVLHETRSGRKFIMVRAKGGGVKRLYEGSLYLENKGDKKALKLVLH
jgi:hypothetical protein